MYKKITVITTVAIIILSIFILFIIQKTNNLNDKILSTNTDTNIIVTGQVYKYTWEKSGSNYDYAFCHGDSDVFKTENSTDDFEYHIEFKDDVNIDEYKGKTITVQGDEVIEKKEIDMNCDEPSQRPVGTCEDSNTSTFICKKIINAVIIE